MKNKNAASLIDVATALSRVSGNKRLYVRIAFEFLKDLETVVDQFNDFLKSSSLQEATRQMHSLKGTAATLGADHLAETATRIEQACKGSFDFLSASSQVEELGQVVQATRIALCEAIIELEAELEGAMGTPPSSADSPLL